MNSIERCNELIKEKHANWIGISNQVAIKEVLDERFKLQARTDRLTVKLEKKEKIIDLMADAMAMIMTDIKVVRKQFEKQYCEFITSDEDCCWKTSIECSDCIKQYFEKKVGE